MVEKTKKLRKDRNDCPKDSARMYGRLKQEAGKSSPVHK